MALTLTTNSLTIMPRHFFKKLFGYNETIALINNVAVTLFGFSTFFLLARALNQERLGEWIIYITAATMIEMVRSGLTRIALIRFLSGASEKEREVIIGANWLISIILTAAIIVVLLAVRLLFSDALHHSAFSAFVIWYPLMAIFNLPYNNVMTFLQAGQKFDRMLWLRTAESGAFVTFLLLNYLYWRVDIDVIIIVHLAIILLVSLFCVSRGWDELVHLRKTDRKTVRMLLEFGKYSLGTLIGSNLLKSTDTFVISASAALGAPAVALYGVPLKLIEILEVPLRSLVATAFPRISAAAHNGDQEAVKNGFYLYAGFSTLLFIPAVIVAFFASDLMIILLAGREYLASSTLFKLFCLYGLLLPLDRFSGVVLDSLNLPRLNFYKVAFMAVINLIGDLVAVFVFKSLIGVALTTIVMTLAGVVWGLWLLRRKLDLHLPLFFILGSRRVVTLYHELVSRRHYHERI